MARTASLHRSVVRIRLRCVKCDGRIDQGNKGGELLKWVALQHVYTQKIEIHRLLDL